MKINFFFFFEKKMKINLSFKSQVKSILQIMSMVKFNNIVYSVYTLNTRE